MTPKKLPKSMRAWTLVDRYTRIVLHTFSLSKIDAEAKSWAYPHSYAIEVEIRPLKKRKVGR